MRRIFLLLFIVVITLLGCNSNKSPETGASSPDSVQSVNLPEVDADKDLSESDQEACNIFKQVIDEEDVNSIEDEEKIEKLEDAFFTADDDLIDWLDELLFQILESEEKDLNTPIDAIKTICSTD